MAIRKLTNQQQQDGGVETGALPTNGGQHCHDHIMDIIDFHNK